MLCASQRETAQPSTSTFSSGGKRTYGHGDSLGFASANQASAHAVTSPPAISASRPLRCAGSAALKQVANAGANGRYHSTREYVVLPVRLLATNVLSTGL